MTLDDVGRLYTYWQRFPTVRSLVAAAIGFKPQHPTTDQKQYMTRDDMMRLMKMTGGKLPGISPNMGGK